MLKYLEIDYELLAVFREGFYDKHLAPWSNAQSALLRELMFREITGEQDFDAFYERMEKIKGAWEGGFLPDMISFVLGSEWHPLYKKRALVRGYYDRCVEAERREARV